MQRTNGTSTQRISYLIFVAVSLLLAISYFQSEKALRAAAYAAIAVNWMILAFGGTKGHRPKWFKFAAVPAVVLLLTFAGLAVWTNG